MSDHRDRGLYRKFHIDRTDGRSAPGEKHHSCDYFVLDLTHDPHARLALATYARSLRFTGDYPALADDLERKLGWHGGSGFRTETDRDMGHWERGDPHA